MIKTTLDRIIPKVESQQSGYSKRIATITSASMAADKNAILRYKRRFIMIFLNLLPTFIYVLMTKILTYNNVPTLLLPLLQSYRLHLWQRRLHDREQVPL